MEEVGEFNIESSRIAAHFVTGLGINDASRFLKFPRSYFYHYIGILHLGLGGFVFFGRVAITEIVHYFRVSAMGLLRSRGGSYPEPKLLDALNSSQLKRQLRLTT